MLPARSSEYPFGSTFTFRRSRHENKEISISQASSDVGNYYNRNTRRFLLSGHGGKRLAIRRAVWGPGVDTRDDAIDYVNRLILDELRTIRTEEGVRPSVLDLGCGVGGSMIYLSQGVDADFHGVTISEVQAALALEFVAERGIATISVDAADYTDRDYWERHGRHDYDLAIAVESFLHVDGLLGHLPLLASRLRPGGTLVVVDDMISRLGSNEPRTRRQSRWLREFRKGWYAHGLTEMEQFVAAAGNAGLKLVEARDLTPFLELDRPRDLLARPLVSALRWLPVRPEWFNNLLGGNALQLALKSHLLGYYFLVLRARSTRTPG